MEGLDARQEAEVARHLRLLAADAAALARGMDLDYPEIFQDRQRERYQFHVDMMLTELNRLIMLSPLEVQGLVGSMGSRSCAWFLSDLATALSRDRAAGDFFREQQRRWEERRVDLRLQALEERVFGNE